MDKFPGSLRNNKTVALSALLVPYPQYGTITQTNTNGKLERTHTFEVRAQRPFTHGLSFVVGYAWNRDRVQEMLDDVAQYKVLTTNGKDGWEWRPTDTPVHRLTAALSWELPIGRDRALLSGMPMALDTFLGGWQYALTARAYSGRPLLFLNSYVVDGNPKLSNPTNDKWFDTSLFHTADSFTPRSNPSWFKGLNGPGVFVTDMTLTKRVNVTSRYHLEARIEAYNALNSIIWDNPELVLSNANFGKVTRKRAAWSGREIQVGLRFLF